MYTAEEKSTGIAYRLVNENLPKFIDNMEAFKKAIARPEIQANMEALIIIICCLLKSRLMSIML